jgi:hypothetical protein
MREIRQSGSEGGVAFGPSLPLSDTQSVAVVIVTAKQPRA